MIMPELCTLLNVNMNESLFEIAKCSMFNPHTTTKEVLNAN